MVVEAFSLQIGSLSSWITAGGVVGVMGISLRFLTKWVEVNTARRKSDHDIAQEIRDGLLERLDQCEANHKVSQEENDKLKERIMLLEDGDRRKTIALTLVMNELVRLDPSSDIILRAKGVLELSLKLETPRDRDMDKIMREMEKGQ